jgi:hypothetical protein
MTGSAIYRWFGLAMLTACLVTLSARSAWSQAAPTEDSLDAELLDGLAPEKPAVVIDGEDLGASEDPLVRLSDQMRDVESSLREARLGPPTQRQQLDIISDLDQLIAQQQKQCQNPSPKPGGKPSSQQKKPSSGAPKPGESPSPTGQQGAADSQDETREGENEEPKFTEPQDLLKRVWGHLPAHMRDQMRQNPNEKFLPKYQREIEDYFRRLIDLEEEATARP